MCVCVISWYKCAWLHTRAFLYTHASVYSITNYGPICVLFDLSVIIAFFCDAAPGSSLDLS